MVVGRGFATVVRHRDFEERSTYYENLVAAEARATKKKAGIHSSKEPPIAHLNDVSDRVRDACVLQHWYRADMID
jgi:staphylococcal nuclease domain-containing protein 1